jgi:hypothetical protein
MAAAFGKVYLSLSGEYDLKKGSEGIDAHFLAGGF